MWNFGDAPTVSPLGSNPCMITVNSGVTLVDQSGFSLIIPNKKSINQVIRLLGLALKLTILLYLLLTSQQLGITLMLQLEGHGTILAWSKLLWSDSSEESISDIAYRIPEATGETVEHFHFCAEDMAKINNEVSIFGDAPKKHKTTQNDHWKPGVSSRFMNVPRSLRFVLF